jgi:uncharacterized protein YbaR (Trm112 family)
MADEKNNPAPASVANANMTPGSPERGIDPKLLELLVCPVSKSTLDYDAVHNELVSRAARLAYPIRDGIPIMLPEEARRLVD